MLDLRLEGTTQILERQILIEPFNRDEKIFVSTLSTPAGGIALKSHRARYSDLRRFRLEADYGCARPGSMVGASTSLMARRTTSTICSIRIAPWKKLFASATKISKRSKLVEEKTDEEDRRRTENVGWTTATDSVLCSTLPRSVSTGISIGSAGLEHLSRSPTSAKRLAMESVESHEGRG